MCLSDSVSDMLTRIRNAQQVKLLDVSVPYSKMKVAILDVLLDEGYINSYDIVGDLAKRLVSIKLKYTPKGFPVIQEIHRVSKPGKRVYSSIKDLKGCYNNMGVYVLSTPCGVVSDRLARLKQVGGEIICKVF